MLSFQCYNWRTDISYVGLHWCQIKITVLCRSLHWVKMRKTMQAPERNLQQFAGYFMLFRFSMPALFFHIFMKIWIRVNLT